jgi:phosphoglycolate phosphatase
MYKMIIFDLDGTLLDTSIGIYNSVRYAEKKLGLKPILDSDLKKFVGPPPKNMYMELYGLNQGTAGNAVRLHREYGKNQGLYEAHLYPNIVDVLSRLKDEGCITAVATLKNQHIAERILEYFDLKKYFEVIIGMDDEETYTKGIVIQKAIEKVNRTGDIVMVGDSQYDWEGASEVGIDFIGVLYGFGFESGIEYPFSTIKNPMQLLGVL